LGERDRPLERALRLIEKDRPLTVGQAVNLFMSKLGLKDYEAARLVYELADKGKIGLEDPNPPKTFFKYLLSLRSLWLWILTSLVFLTLLSIHLSETLHPLIYLRYALGSMFVLYLPGASLIEALYPKKGDLSQLERLALSIGLSLALVPLVGLILNYTPWGIRLTPILASLTALTLALSFLASYRKFIYFRLEMGE
jgi:hypothetical protein